MKFLVVLISFCLSISPLSFAQKKVNIEKVYSSYLRGLYYIEEGDYQKGLRELKRAKKLDPNSLYVRLKIAALYIRMGDLDKAEDELIAAKRIDPDGFDVPLALIFLYSYTQKDKELESEYESFLKKAHSLKPEDILISEYLAQFYFYKKRYQDAIKIYKALLDKSPDYVEGMFWLGFLYEDTGKDKEAIAIWKKALELDPYHAPTLNSLGYLYIEKGTNLNDAEKMIKKALEKEPENGAFLDSLGWLYFKKGNYKKAASYLEKALAFEKDPVIYDHLGDAYMKLGDSNKALLYYKEGLESFPDNENLKEKIKTYGEEDSIIKREGN